VNRPTRELKGFQKILLKPGESRRVEFVLDHRSLAFFHPGKKQWTVEPGAFTIEAGASSRDIRLKKVFNVVQGHFICLPVTSRMRKVLAL
jgi:beta-glucosidase